MKHNAMDIKTALIGLVALLAVGACQPPPPPIPAVVVGTPLEKGQMLVTTEDGISRTHTIGFHRPFQPVFDEFQRYCEDTPGCKVPDPNGPPIFALTPTTDVSFLEGRIDRDGNLDRTSTTECYSIVVEKKKGEVK
jgi:hypothetical protein